MFQEVRPYLIRIIDDRFFFSQVRVYVQYLHILTINENHDCLYGYSEDDGGP